MLVGIWKGTPGTRQLAHCPEQKLLQFLALLYIRSMLPHRELLPPHHKSLLEGRALLLSHFRGFPSPRCFSNSNATSFTKLFHVTLASLESMTFTSYSIWKASSLKEGILFHLFLHPPSVSNSLQPHELWPTSLLCP